MRDTFTSIRDGRASKGYALTETDLENIVAEHLGLDPGTAHFSGLRLENGELHVSGVTPEHDGLDGPETPGPGR